MLKTILIALIAVSSTQVLAAKVLLNQSLPSVSIINGGEISYQQNQYSYAPWSTKMMLGKVRVTQAIAGRSNSKKMNQALMNQITQQNFPKDKYQTTTIINQNDAIWGTSSFVQSSAEKSKKEFSWSSIVLDKNGIAAKTWELKPESSAIIVQDIDGKVLFFQEGKLSKNQMAKVISLIKDNIK